MLIGLAGDEHLPSQRRLLQESARRMKPHEIQKFIRFLSILSNNEGGLD